MTEEVVPTPPPAPKPGKLNQTALHVINYGGSAGLATALLELGKRFNITLSTQESMYFAIAIVWLWHRVQPIAAMLYKKVLVWAGAAAIIVCCFSGTAHATNARITLQCGRETVLDVPDAAGNRPTVCLEQDVETYMDLVVGAQLVAIQLTGHRQIVTLGAAPSLGVIIAWRPSWWTATPLLLGGELLVSMTMLVANNDAMGFPDHFEAWTVAALNVLGYLSIGVGGRYGIATRDGVADFAELVFTGGLRIPI